METKVYYTGGAVESHRFPEPVGATFSVFDEDAGTERSYCSLDQIADVVDRVYIDAEGLQMERFFAKADEGGAHRRTYANRSWKNCVLAASYFANVNRITVDDEQIYPLTTGNA